MSFSFETTAGASQSTSKPRLEGNKIHSVKLEKVEKQDITGVKDPTMTYRVIKFRFSNDDGYYEHTIFEPRKEDFERVPRDVKNKNGNIESIPQPSNVESMMLFFKHVMDSYVPEIAQKIDSGEKKLVSPDWDSLRDLVIKICSQSKDRVSNIKLMKGKDGEGRFPGFFVGINKEGKSYIRNNFIGNKIAFNPYEIIRIDKENNAHIENTSSPDDLNLGSENKSDLDLNFDVDSL